MASADIVVVGGGFAGLAAAAALSHAGADVTVLEAMSGPIAQFRGELIHPRGARMLSPLGLMSVLGAAGKVDIVGFAAFAPDDPVGVTLPYGCAAGVGVGVEHGAMIRAFRSELTHRPKIRLLTGKRVERALFEHGRVVGVACSDGSTYRGDWVVGADGRHSKIRKLCALPAESRIVSYTLALSVQGDPLPNPGHGHVFLGAPGPILAYSYKAQHVRMCVDFPRVAEGGQKAMLERIKAGHAAHVPEPLRTKMIEAIDEGRFEACPNHEVTTKNAVGHGLALVGDAGGCSHPLTATGLTSALHDATALAHCLSLHGPTELALFTYQKKRYQYVRARELFTRALYDVFSARDRKGRVLREGLFRYWRGSDRARAVSMGILSGEEATRVKFMLEYARVLALLPEMLAARSLNRIHHAHS